MKKPWLFFIGFAFLILLEIAKVYFIMPFPGSQQSNTIQLAYFLHNNVWWLRILGVLLLVGPLLKSLSEKNILQKVILVLVIMLYGFIYYLFNFRFLADKIFYEPKIKTFASPDKDTTNRDALIIGVVSGNKAKAYPIQIIGYHHQVQDSLLQEPILVTYCTVCRTGRVFSPMVKGKKEQFRLVGMDHFNAMFEDMSTKSWWQQATGESIAGEMKGSKLIELPSSQMRLGDWLDLYPGSEIMQQDTLFKKEYADLKGYDEGTIKGGLEHRDSLSWKKKSWIIGLHLKSVDRAYDWNELEQKKMISDSIDQTPVLITMESNKKTFHSFSRKYKDMTLQFLPSAKGDTMEDQQTHSIWKKNGICINGVLKGAQLENLQSYQEFWHSWKQFHPNTSIFHT
jgi:hypothetical protein